MGSMFLFQLYSNAGLYDLSLWHVLVWDRILARKQFFAFCLIALVSTMSSPLEVGSMVYLDLYVMLKRSWTIFTVYFFIFLNPTTSSWFVSVFVKFSHQRRFTFVFQSLEHLSLSIWWSLWDLYLSQFGGLCFAFGPRRSFLVSAWPLCCGRFAGNSVCLSS